MAGAHGEASAGTCASSCARQPRPAAAAGKSHPRTGASSCARQLTLAPALAVRTDSQFACVQLAQSTQASSLLNASANASSSCAVAGKVYLPTNRYSSGGECEYETTCSGKRSMMLLGMRDDPPAPYAPRPPGALPCCCWRRDMLAPPLGRLALPRPESSRAGRPAPGPAQSRRMCICYP